MGDLTAHFSAWEFQSRDSAWMPDEVVPNVLKTALMLEKVRKALSTEAGKDAPIVVFSGYRSPTHNKQVGGAKNSYHLKGMAADISCPLLPPRRVQNVCRKLQAYGVIGGLGSYPGFTHVDWGPTRSWSTSKPQP